MSIPAGITPRTALRTSSPGALDSVGNFGRYELLGRIAYGGMAEIFLAREPLTRGSARLLALKKILPHVADDENFVQMFTDEARLAIQLNHPNICHIYECGELEGAHFIAMEWIDGTSLGRIVRRASRSGGGMPPHLAAWVIARIAEALDYAHQARDSVGQPLGIVHRDVSPHNIMVSYGGVVKLLDFGIAKAQTHSIQTRAGVIKGKFAYMSPQQCRGIPIDGRADIFALGVCMFEALTGKSPFKHDAEYETMRAVVEEPTPSIRQLRPELDVELEAIVCKALEKKPPDRFQTGEEMQNAIEDWLARTGQSVNRSKLAAYMEEAFHDEIERGPSIDTNPSGSSLKSFRASSPSLGGGSGLSWHTPISEDESIDVDLEEIDAPGGEQRRRVLRWGVVLAVVAAAGGIAFLTTPSNDDADETRADEADAPTAPPAPEEAPPEEAPVTTGTVVVRSTPTGAAVDLDGAPTDRVTPAEITDVAPGAHAVVVRHAGHSDWSSEVELAAGDRVVLVARLEPIPVAPVAEPRAERDTSTRRHKQAADNRPTGRLSINTRPWSRVFVGSRALGTTPIGGVPVPSGSVRLRIVDRDGRTHNRTVQVPAGGEERVFFDLSQ